MRTTFLTNRAEPVAKYTMDELLEIPFTRFSEVSCLDLLLRLRAEERAETLSELLLLLENIGSAHIEEVILQNEAARDAVGRFLAALTFLVNSSAAPQVVKFLQKLAHKRLIKSLQLCTTGFIDNLALFFDQYFDLCAPIIEQILPNRDRLERHFIEKYGQMMVQLANCSHGVCFADAAFRISPELYENEDFEMHIVDRAVAFLMANYRAGPCEHALYALGVAGKLYGVNCNKLPDIFDQLYALYGGVALKSYCSITKHEKTQFCLNSFVGKLLEITVEEREDGETAAEILLNISQSACCASLVPLNTDILTGRGRRTQALLLAVLENLYVCGNFEPSIDDFRELITLIGQMLRLRYCTGVQNAFNLLKSIAFRDGVDLLQEFGIVEQASMCQALFGDGEWSEFVTIQ